VTVAEHVYDVPNDDELARLIGAATPHFALQIRDRVAKLAAALPPDHPRQPALREHIARLERLAFHGETAMPEQRDLPARPSLVPQGMAEPAAASPR
jgi:hypothetical protein